MASAATSGWYTGATGRARRGILLRPHSNCGVFRPGIWTIVMWTWLLSWISSDRSESVKPRMAALAAEKADWSGMLR
jgi:hypothetical protein